MASSASRAPSTRPCSLLEELERCTMIESGVSWTEEGERERDTHTHNMLTTLTGDPLSKPPVESGDHEGAL